MIALTNDTPPPHSIRDRHVGRRKEVSRERCTTRHGNKTNTKRSVGMGAKMVEQAAKGWGQ